MEYKEFRSELLKKLEEKTNQLGYHKVEYYPDGFTTQDPEKLSTIRNTNIKYHKVESDTLSGDFVCLLTEEPHQQMCRFSLQALYEAFAQDGWEAVWTIINSNLAMLKNYAKLGIVELLEKGEYEPLKDKLFIRPLNYHDHRYELKDNVYQHIGDIVLVLYLLGKNEWSGSRHDIMSIKVPRKIMEQWGLPEDEIWDNAMSNTYMMSPPRMYFNPMDTYNPPYHKGAFMALNSDITSIPAQAVPVITTTTQMNGAIAMFYPGVTERLAELLGGDYYVVFTSIHDVILHKKGTVVPLHILRSLKDTNKTFDPEELLSRKIYLYEAASKELKQLEL